MILDLRFLKGNVNLFERVFLFIYCNIQNILYIIFYQVSRNQEWADSIVKSGAPLQKRLHHLI